MSTDEKAKKQESSPFGDAIQTTCPIGLASGTARKKLSNIRNIAVEPLSFELQRCSGLGWATR